MNLLQNFAVALTLLIGFYFVQARNYDKYSIYNVYIKQQDQLDFLNDLDKKKHLDIVFPEMPPENEIAQVLVNNAVELDFVNRLESYKISSNKIANSAQKVFDDQLSIGTAFHPRVKSETIRSLTEIYTWLNRTAEEYPDITTLESIGTTFEGRDILVFSIKIRPRSNYSHLKAFIESSIHGNEWLGAATSLFMIENILKATNGPYHELKKKYFLYFIPVLNPDGYEYSQKSDPLWKKNRRKTGPGTYGVNLNRNFAYNFGGPDSSHDPNSMKYCGPHTFSEAETAALRNFIERKRHQITFYFSLHGYGQKFIIPFSDNQKHFVNYHEVHLFSKKAAQEIHKLSEKIFKIGTAPEILGRRYSGDSASWIKKTYHFPYTLSVQLRDDGEEGIALPNSEIEPACHEISRGLTTFMLSTGQYRPYVDKAFYTSKIDLSLLLLMVLLLIFIY